MSEGNGANSGIPNADSENVLDDLMQNNVQFDEDEKPKTVSFQLKMQGRSDSIADSDASAASSGGK